MLTKAYEGALKQLNEQGEGIAVIATLGVIDRDGDLTEPGAFGEQTVPVVYAHDWGGRPPIGKAVVREERHEAVAAFRLNLKTSGGREVYEALRFDLEHPPAKQQWSYGFSIAKDGGSAAGTFEGQPVRFLKKLQVHEVSPVLLGAGVNTRTVMVKRRSAMKDLWLTVDQVNRLCPPCAEKMRAKGIHKIALAELAKSLHGEDELLLVEALAHVNEASMDLSTAAWESDPERRQEAVRNAIAHLERAEERAEEAVGQGGGDGEDGEQKAFADYADFDDCVAQNQDKDDPNAYCAAIQAQSEGNGKSRARRVGRKTMAQQMFGTVADLKATIARLDGIRALRAKDGRDLSEERRVHLAEVRQLLSKIDEMLDDGAKARDAVRRYYALKEQAIKEMRLG